MSSSDNLLQDSSSQGCSNRQEFDDIEGLIAKEQEQIEREQALENGEALKPPDVAMMPAAGNSNDEHPMDHFAGMLRESQTDLKIKEASLVTPELLSMATPGAIRIHGIDAQRETEQGILDDEEPLNRSAAFADEPMMGQPYILCHREENIVKATLIEEDEEAPMGPVVVAEEQTETTKNRRKLYIGLGLLLIVSAVVIGVSVALKERKKGGVSSSGAADPTIAPSQLGPLAPSRPPSELLTAGAFLDVYRGTVHEANGTMGSYDFQTYHLAAKGNGILEFLNRPDIALTIFAPAGRAFQNYVITTEFVAKYLSDSWVGHSRSMFLNFVVVHDIPLFSSTIKDGSLFTTESDSQITIERTNTDFAVITENVSIPVKAPVQVPDIPVSNGVIHTLFDFYYPPWFNRTIYEVLVATNATRGGDLSILLSLLDTSSTLRAIVQERGGGPLSLFAPINSAFSGLSSGLVDAAIANGLEDNSTLFMLIKNHFASANYVSKFQAWKRIPEGTKVGTDQIVLQSKSNSLLTVTFVNNETTTINDIAKVLEFDLFSEFGIVQIIDELLIIDGLSL